VETQSAPGSEDFSVPTLALTDEVVERLSRVLRPCIKQWVFSYDVPSWTGQEDDVAADLLQDTFEKLWRHLKKIEHGLAAPITSLEAICFVIARRCCLDRRRKDWRLRRFPEENARLDDLLGRTHWVDPVEIAIENMYRAWLFLKVSYIIGRFSPKKREALLIDLAKLMDFEDQLTPLQQGLLAQGIHIHEYLGKKPTTPKAKARHSSLLSGAYKQVSREASAF
jgi:DNA-directed RNA polymerase specialized sigma24 family protein